MGRLRPLYKGIAMANLSRSQSLLSNIRGELAGEFLEREEIINGLLVGMVAGAHTILLGPPGTAKSALVTSLSSRINGCTDFIYLLTKFTTPEEVFGPVSLKGLENDRFERVTTGKLPTANIAFLDETFKANSAILNSLLTILNERKFDNGGMRQNVPLISLVGASNETPQDESLAALYDRFMLRYVSDYISDEANMANLLLTSPAAPAKQTTIDLSELMLAHKEAQSVNVSQDIIREIISLKRAFAAAGITASDRRWKHSIDVVKAVAYMDGRAAVEADDLLIYSNIMWDDPKDRGAVSKVVNDTIQSDYSRILQIRDAVDQIIRDFKKAINAPESSRDKGFSPEALAIEAMAKCRALDNKLQKLRGGGQRGDNLKTEITGKWKKALAETIGL